MANPYTAPSISGYNTNPPPDDGSNTAANEILWATQKTKLADPIKTLAEADITATTAAFLKVLGGNGVTSTAISYTVVAGDQGKLVRATAASITITTPDATDVTAPFVFALLNNSSGTITFDGSGSQTIDGNASVTVPAGAGMMVFTDGTDWFTTGQQGLLVGKQLMYGDIINGTIAQSNAANAVTFSLKTLAGADPSSTDPVLVCFRSATSTSGLYVYRNITSATSLTISAGSTLGTQSAKACRIWLVLFDDAGTVRLGAVNCLSGVNIYPLRVYQITSSTAEGGAGGADSSGVFYTGTAVTSKPYLVFATATYESGLSTAGNWNVDPVLRLQGKSDPLPGDTVQTQQNTVSTVATGTTAIPLDDTIPQITEGDQYMSQAITPISAANVLTVETSAYGTNSAANNFIGAIFQDAAASALAAGVNDVGNGNSARPLFISYSFLANTTSSTTIKFRAGSSTGATTTFNGSAGSQYFGGVLNSYMKITERVA